MNVSSLIIFNKCSVVEDVFISQMRKLRPRRVLQLVQILITPNWASKSVYSAFLTASGFSGERGESPLSWGICDEQLLVSTELGGTESSTFPHLQFVIL